MRRNVKVKAVSTRVPLRKAATTASAASRKAFPAWIDATDGAAFPATLVTPHVRSALVLRPVRKQAANPRSAAHDLGGR
jgi:hypothetical protein